MKYCLKGKANITFDTGLYPVSSLVLPSLNASRVLSLNMLCSKLFTLIERETFNPPLKVSQG